MIVDFSIYELLYNKALKGMIMHIDGIDDIVKYVKPDKDSRQMLIVMESGRAYPMNIDRVYSWNVLSKNEWIAPTEVKIKGNKI